MVVFFLISHFHRGSSGNISVSRIGRQPRFNGLCSFGNAKVGEAKVGEAQVGEAKVFIFCLFWLHCVAGVWQAKVHTNIFEKAKIGEQNNLIMGNKYGQTIIF